MIVNVLAIRGHWEWNVAPISYFICRLSCPGVEQGLIFYSNGGGVTVQVGKVWGIPCHTRKQAELPRPAPQTLMAKQAAEDVLTPDRRLLSRRRRDPQPG